MSRTILITGASSGLGEGMAREFAARGDHLALCARRTERLDQLRAELEGTYPGVKISVRALDVNDHAQVAEVFQAFREEFGQLDRIIVNAGIGKGQPLGTGRFDANRQTAETNFVSALAQIEAAMEIFRAQNHGHLVAVSSVTAVRGMPGNVTTYAAIKAGLAALCEGLRVELKKRRSPIRVTTLYPGYIRTEINEKVKNTPFIVDAKTGCRAMVRAIESGKAERFVPGWPWTPIGFILRRLPESVLARIF
ncbi:MULTISPECIES: SDR family oxidoreductase [Marinobacter]|jgi:short-subunit dehydrogenase|uniref:Oxidoreductase, short-chain dehydrogenase/reductase family n=1 Tax=Marinobacter excellens LAMA 842 TaxID=1306954 RepID=A0A137SG81_9GAMM|nr:MULTISPECIES: SDR family oxidoreductase [Marinobacter]KXO10781.1 Oxidoreductase, short-chain dehydrogenase/reductase family [Marinobacter excellens LAMA 842]KXO11446.1 Oxidoreductase, short-chain dehydrogenase/reductase family [Marinobacter excellens LAMA 842]MCD1629204.1 SDR family oxidoreductase [Marinobacter shengliensis]